MNEEYEKLYFAMANNINTTTFENDVAETREQLRMLDLEYKRKRSPHEMKLQRLLDNCPHRVRTFHSKYYEGGYDYVAQTHTWEKCSCCHKTLNKIIKSHPGRYA